MPKQYVQKQLFDFPPLRTLIGLPIIDHCHQPRGVIMTFSGGGLPLPPEPPINAPLRGRRPLGGSGGEPGWPLFKGPPFKGPPFETTKTRNDKNKKKQKKQRRSCRSGALKAQKNFQSRFQLKSSCGNCYLELWRSRRISTQNFN